MTDNNTPKKRDRQSILIGSSLPNMPWQEKPEGYPLPVWRDTRNPIIHRSPFPECNSVFNSAVVPFKGKFAGVFRCDNTARDMQLHVGFSDDAILWDIKPTRIEFVGADPEVAKWVYGYDPRVVWIEDRYYVTWCNGYHGPTIGVAWTQDFETFHQLENAFLIFNRNGVLFPRKINGDYMMLSRPSDNGHTPFGDIYVSASPDMVHWGRHRHVMAANHGWQHLKIGAGPIPIETPEGWLMFYHGVLLSCNGYIYSWSVALLDLDEPWKVIRRAKPYLINPRETYETIGDVQNVTFPTAALCDAETGRIAIYYGCADTTTALSYCYADEVLDWLDKNSSI
jgi:beta-1,4-mannooligosaccharide/beta-1,4-mannosyl-N-acetylglucosamine phosphorylase